MRGQLRFLVLLACICPSAVFGEEPEKIVKRIWFPRFSADSKLLATAHGGWDAKEGGEARIWDAASGKQKLVLKQPRGIRSVALSKDSTLLAAGGYGSTITVYDLQSGKPIQEWKTPSGVENLGFQPDGLHLFSALGDGSVRLWNAKTGKETQTLSGLHSGEIWGMAVSPDGTHVATSGQDLTINVTNVKTGNHPPQFPQLGSNSVAFTSDGKRLAAGGADSLIMIYDLETGAELHKLKGHQGGKVTDLQFGANDQILASAGMDRTVQVWDLSDSQAPKLKKTLTAHQDFVFGVALSLDGKRLASAGWDDRINVWDTDSFQEIWSWDRAASK